MGVFNKVLDVLGLLDPQDDTMDEVVEKGPQRGNATPAVPSNVARSVIPARNMANSINQANNNLVQLQPKDSAAAQGKTTAVSAQNNLMSSARMILQQPQDFNAAQKIADSLLSGMGVIINIEECDPDTAEKIIDFVGGVIYAIGGDIQKVSAGTILATPVNINISSELKDEMSKQDNLSSDEVFSWVTSYNQRGEF